MSLDAAHTQLSSIITSDADVVAWANTHFGKALTVLNGNRELKEFRDYELPALVFEIVNGDSEPLNNSNYAETSQEIKFGFVWYEPDFTASFTQRKTLPDLIVKAVLRNKTLNSTVSEAAVNSWSFAQGVNTPEVHSARFSAGIVYGLTIP